jgi:RND family efflux transporter MFP subunit
MKRFMSLALAAAVSGGCGAGEHASQGSAPAAETVATQTVSADPLATTFEAGGTVRAAVVAPLSSRIVSPIVAVHVASGDRVRRGQPLVTLDARQLDASAATARSAHRGSIEGAAAADAEAAAADAALALAVTSHGRIAKLRERNSATQGELDEAVAALRAAEARVSAARARRAEIAEAVASARSSSEVATVSATYAVISAPFDGLVTDVPAEVGAMAAPGVPLVVVEDNRRFRLELSVDASRAALIAKGAQVPVAIDGLEPLTGTVVDLTESVDPAAHAMVVKVELPAGAPARSGLFGRARFSGPPQPALSIPTSALVRRGQLTLAFVDEKGTARMRVVHAGGVHDGRVEILAGLEAGESVVINPPPTLRDGTPIRSDARRQP